MAKIKRRLGDIKEKGQSIGWTASDVVYFRPEVEGVEKYKLPVFTIGLLTMKYATIRSNSENMKIVTGGDRFQSDVMFSVIKEFVKDWTNYRTESGRIAEHDLREMREMRHSMKSLLYYAIFNYGELTQEEIEGINILAGIHAGALAKYDCAKCKRTPGLTEKFGMVPVRDKETGVQIGCEPGAGLEPIIENDKDDLNPEAVSYYNCPLKFIPDSVIKWFDLYSYYSNYPSSAPKYEDQTQRYINAMRCYTAVLNSYRK